MPLAVYYVFNTRRPGLAISGVFELAPLRTLVLYAGFLLEQSRVHGQGRGFRTQPSGTAA
jgi:hypothetical protein